MTSPERLTPAGFHVIFATGNIRQCVLKALPNCMIDVEPREESSYPDASSAVDCRKVAHESKTRDSQYFLSHALSTGFWLGIAEVRLLRPLRYSHTMVIGSCGGHLHSTNCFRSRTVDLINCETIGFHEVEIGWITSLT
jgi:hypothetical protein